MLLVLLLRREHCVAFPAFSEYVQAPYLFVKGADRPWPWPPLTKVADADAAIMKAMAPSPIASEYIYRHFMIERRILNLLTKVYGYDAGQVDAFYPLRRSVDWAVSIDDGVLRHDYDAWRYLNITEHRPLPSRSTQHCVEGSGVPPAAAQDPQEMNRIMVLFDLAFAATVDRRVAINAAMSLDIDHRLYSDLLTVCRTVPPPPSYPPRWWLRFHLLSRSLLKHIEWMEAAWQALEACAKTATCTTAD